MTQLLVRDAPFPIDVLPAGFEADLASAASGDPTGQLLKYLFRGFDDVLDDDAYHVTDDEARLIQDVAPDVAETVGMGGHMIELGCGTASAVRAKTVPLVRELRPTSYTANDLWPEHAEAGRATVADAFPGLKVSALAADFMNAARPWPVTPGSVLCIGATISNLITDPTVDEAHDVLRGSLTHLARLAGPDGHMIVSYDTTRDGLALERIYNTAAHSRFRLGIVPMIDALCRRDIDARLFSSPAVWSPRKQCLTHLLIPKERIEADLARAPFVLERGQPLPLGVSYKFTPEVFAAAAGAADIALSGRFTRTDNSAALETLSL
ncbi:L-histidine N(alpha)-methyltransferase [Acuticoccus sp. MNP-M23]|uniref:L-histidine N(alpha)-methyltransferase n=1 Tax=Acuticoccus sp. MNP-M23 TaxID=3072793 RepID=UPI002815801F|nr:L-histidine N(alpha)-methyltransferase [Acuticoccus sp. MNP-M23]WMS43110.1 L-histidine N(alpha)-methyltransferase [Acuticoccus sp. MNP-M23]